MLSKEENDELYELKKEFYKQLTAYHSEKRVVNLVPLINRIEQTNKNIKELNNNIKEASTKSGELASALNKITNVAALIAGLGVITAIVSLAFEIYKYLN